HGRQDGIMTMGSKPSEPDEAVGIHPADFGLSYKSAGALHDAIKSRLKVAAERGPYDVNELRRQFAYDRLLTRVFEHAPEKWLVKGGTGLLARIPQHARHTNDVDLHYQGEETTVIADLHQAVDLDLGDYFSFDLEEVGELTGVNSGSKIRAVAYIGDTRFSNFEIDAVVASNMTAAPELVDALTPITIEGLQVNQYRAYPIVDHVADKHAAMVAIYSDGHPSTRYRDLVDIVIIATSQHIEAAALHEALMSEYQHRDLEIPTGVEIPSDDWIDGYAKQANHVPDLDYQTADEGLAVASAFLNPILEGRNTGSWSPATLEWSD
ncbi:MAG: nucleotidyl transferase AbiEii/AbiGii toxin family protein, partial [Actinomycetota bacterium]|nr:nucleotidyl transferase AbiEii/AbiGii toxin family protein [Actinomycetota bacterium]